MGTLKLSILAPHSGQRGRLDSSFLLTGPGFTARAAAVGTPQTLLGQIIANSKIAGHRTDTQKSTALLDGVDKEPEFEI